MISAVMVGAVTIGVGSMYYFNMYNPSTAAVVVDSSDTQQHLTKEMAVSSSKTPATASTAAALVQSSPPLESPTTVPTKQPPKKKSVGKPETLDPNRVSVIPFPAEMKDSNVADPVPVPQHPLDGHRVHTVSLPRS
jgi:cytoskeletal protein RodZ